MFTRTGLIVVALAALICVPCLAQDTDGDGISDATEEILGTDPGFAEELLPVMDEGLESDERRAAEGYDATKDILTVEFCSVAENRCLWRVTFAAPPRLEDTVCHLYVNADEDETTGRQNHRGTDYMLSVVGGSYNSGYYKPEGERVAGPPVYFATEGNALLICAD